METLFLPTEFSLGKITIYPPGETESPQQLNAQGTVHVPKVAKLCLDVRQELYAALRNSWKLRCWTQTSKWL